MPEWLVPVVLAVCGLYAAAAILIGLQADREARQQEAVRKQKQEPHG